MRINAYDVVQMTFIMIKTKKMNAKKQRFPYNLIRCFLWNFYPKMILLGSQENKIGPKKGILGQKYKNHDFQ